MTPFQKTCLCGKLIVNSQPHMAALADPPKAKCSYIDPLSFMCSSNTAASGPKRTLVPQGFYINPSLSEKQKNSFSFGAFLDLSSREHIALCDGFDAIMKLDPLCMKQVR